MMHGQGFPKNSQNFRGFPCGNHDVIDYTNLGLGELNPIRYRSYYYDTETGLYYLNSRYYDPEIGRFISPDDISYLDPETIGGTNLYAYCGNNPVMRVDPSGHDWWHWLVSGLEFVGGIVLCFVPGWQAVGGTLIGTAIGSIINGYLAEANGGSFNAGWLGGQVAGFLSGIPAVGTAIGGFAGSVATDFIDSGFNWDKIDWEKAKITSIIGYGFNALPTIISQVVRKMKIGNILIDVVTFFDSTLISIVNSIVNTFWRGYNGRESKEQVFS